MYACRSPSMKIVYVTWIINFKSRPFSKWNCHINQYKMQYVITKYKFKDDDNDESQHMSLLACEDNLDPWGKFWQVCQPFSCSFLNNQEGFLFSPSSIFLWQAYSLMHCHCHLVTWACSANSHQLHHEHSTLNMESPCSPIVICLPWFMHLVKQALQS